MLYSSSSAHPSHIIAPHTPCKQTPATTKHLLHRAPTHRRGSRNSVPAHSKCGTPPPPPTATTHAHAVAASESSRPRQQRQRGAPPRAPPPHCKGALKPTPVVCSHARRARAPLNQERRASAAALSTGSHAAQRVWGGQGGGVSTSAGRSAVQLRRLPRYRAGWAHAAAAQHRTQTHRSCGPRYPAPPPSSPW